MEGVRSDLGILTLVRSLARGSTLLPPRSLSFGAAAALSFAPTSCLQGTRVLMWLCLNKRTREIALGLFHGR